MILPEWRRRWLRIRPITLEARRNHMAVTVFSTGNTKTLDPGQTGHWWWNNAAPSKGVWSAMAVPVATGSTSAGFNQDTQVEVTRIWQRFKVIEKSTTQISDTDIETEIHYEVKNIGSTKATFVVYFSVAS
jgi:hypothetical protein